MRLLAMLAVLVCATASAQDIVVQARRITVNNVVSAQEHAEHLAATGTFGHCGRRGGGYEGIGMSSASAEDAIRRCCYWGKRRATEIGTAWSPLRRAWIAVVRYE